MAGTIVHLSRKMCGYFTHTYFDGSTETFYNGYFGFVRPDGAIVNIEGICYDDLFLHPSDVADGYNPAVGDRVTFRRGTHNGRAKAVEVQRLYACDVTQRLSQPTYRLVPSDYRPLPAMRGENKPVSLVTYPVDPVAAARAAPPLEHTEGDVERLLAAGGLVRVAGGGWVMAA